MVPPVCIYYVEFWQYPVWKRDIARFGTLEEDKGGVFAVILSTLRCHYGL